MRARPTLLVATTRWWALSARLTAVLVKQGLRVSAICPSAHPITFVPGLERVWRYGGARSLKCLERALLEGMPDVVIPCDDGVVGQLHELHARAETLRPLIERSLGAPEGYPILASRHQLLEHAAALGIKVPTTFLITSREELIERHRQLGSPVVVKVDGECAGNGVTICRSIEESVEAWRALRRRPSLLAGLKRTLIDRDPLSLWSRRRPRGITLQRFIRGRPATLMMACRDGRVISHATMLVVVSAGHTGASMIVRRIEDARAIRTAERLAQSLKLTGFYGLDFMIEERSNEAYLIEMNPRCTQVGHMEFIGQPSLIAELAASWANRPRPAAETPIRNPLIALFPVAEQEGARLAHVLPHCYLDLPAEAELLRELRLPYWPQRQWLARLYHAFRPPDRVEPVEFESLGSEEEARESAAAGRGRRHAQG